MSTWQPGKTYDYYGQPLMCLRRYFAGMLEMVDLAPPLQAVADGRDTVTVFTRTARALAPCVVPRVTDTLGGVLRPEACDHHDSYKRVDADAGPNIGKMCCSACGGEVKS